MLSLLVGDKQKKQTLKNNKRIYLIAILLVAMGYFFYAWKEVDGFYAQNYAQKKDLIAKIDLKQELGTTDDQFGTRKEFEQNEKNLTGLNFFAVSSDKEVKTKLYELVGDAPIKEMVPFIAEHEKVVAGLIVGIAKKESAWGEHAPSLNGQDCFNYWGYKGAGSRGTSMGYGCFASPEEGVQVIGARIAELANKNINTPSKMIVWKCGSASCTGHDPVAVRKWINDVDMYFSKIIAFAG